MKRFSFMGSKVKEDRCQHRMIHQERIDAAQKTAMTVRENQQLAMLFKTLGDPTRLRIIWALQYGEMCVCDLAVFLGVSESAVSHQLRLLRQLHLVTKRREGPVLYYSLENEHVSKVILLLHEII